MKPATTKHSKANLKRLVEAAVQEHCQCRSHGWWFTVDELEAAGQPVASLKVWATLRVLADQTSVDDAMTLLQLEGHRLERVDQPLQLPHIKVQRRTERTITC